jgi:hypothetical protein
VQLKEAMCSAALREAAMQARRARTHVQAFAALPITCPLCPERSQMPLTGCAASWKLQGLATALKYV